MKPKLLVILFIGLFLFAHALAAAKMKRNYCLECDDFVYEATGDCFCLNGCCHCLDHYFGKKIMETQVYQGISFELLRLIPPSGRCEHRFFDEKIDFADQEQCTNRGIYSGYFDYSHLKYISHLYHHLLLKKQNPECSCFWPEKSSSALHISNKAYDLFRNLITTTVLESLLDNVDTQGSFLGIEVLWQNKNVHGLSVFCVSNQLWFSDYCEVCHDIGKYIEQAYRDSRCSYQEWRFVQEKLDDILDSLYPDFEILYETCLAKHHHLRIEQELQFLRYITHRVDRNESRIVAENASFKPIYIESHRLDHEGLFLDSLPLFGETPFLTKITAVDKFGIENTSHVPLYFESQRLIEEGIFLNSLLLFKEAIPVLTRAIAIDKFSYNAYIERAIAYFETNQLDLALKDYEQAKLLYPHLNVNQQTTLSYLQFNQNAFMAVYTPKKKIDFTKGLTKGVLRGVNDGVEQFIPSLLNTFTGLSNGLWAFATAPIESTQLMADTAYEIAEYMSNTCLGDCAEALVPELKELKTSWHKLEDEARGYQIGYIIGKYGIDVFGGYGAVKVVHKSTQLRHANALMTLSVCSSSPANRAAIVKQSSELAKARTRLAATGKKGKILVRNSNVAYHVMQKKHAWETVIKISGNREEDFKKVLVFLEDNFIMNKKNLIDTRPIERGKIFRKDYRIQVNGYLVEATFETYVETGEIFLKNAWVVQ